MVEDIFSGSSDDLPLAFFPNANNKGYCRAILDPVSLQILSKHVGSVEEPADRTYLWRTLADHVALGKLPPTAFLRSVFEHLQKEHIEFGIQIIIDKAMYMVNNFFDHESLVEMRTRVFYTLLAKLEATQSPSMQNLLATNMLSVASVDKLDILISWLSAGAICSESASSLQKILPLSKALRY